MIGTALMVQVRLLTYGPGPSDQRQPRGSSAKPTGCAITDGNEIAALGHCGDGELWAASRTWPVRQPKKTSASSWRRGGTVLTAAVAVASLTRMISVPRNATITPPSPSCTASTACTPNRVAKTRS